MPFRPDSPRRARLLGIALLMATFVAGGLGGAAMTRALQATEAAPAAAPPTRCGERKQRILDQLNLTAEQRAQVEQILERRRAETERFWDSAGPRLRTITDSTRAEIRALLTPEQQALYDRLRAEKKAARARRDDWNNDRSEGTR